MGAAGVGSLSRESVQGWGGMGSGNFYRICGGMLYSGVGIDPGILKDPTPAPGYPVLSHTCSRLSCAYPTDMGSHTCPRLSCTYLRITVGFQDKGCCSRLSFACPRNLGSCTCPCVLGRGTGSQSGNSAQHHLQNPQTSAQRGILIRKPQNSPFRGSTVAKIPQSSAHKPQLNLSLAEIPFFGAKSPFLAQPELENLEQPHPLHQQRGPAPPWGGLG